MKKILKTLLCLMIVLLLTGCGEKKYEEDISVTYKDYWDYSLGEYTVTTEKDSDNGGGSGGLTWSSWTNYSFEFKDVNNNTRIITVGNDIDDFNDKILYAATDFLNEDIKDIFTNKVIKETEGIDTQYDISARCEVKKVNEYENLYDSTNGLRFKDLSLKNLNNNNLKVTIYTTVSLDGEIKDYPNLKDKLLNDVKFIFEDYEYQNITYKFNIEPSEDWYSSYYILTYDGYNYNWDIVYLGEGK